MDILKIDVTIYSQIVSTIINSGSIINTMQEDLAIKLGLDLQPELEISIIVQSSHYIQCLVCIDNALVTIEDIIIYILIFVFSGGDQDFILRWLWCCAALLEIKEELDRSNSCMIYTPGQGRWLTFTSYWSDIDDSVFTSDVWKNHPVALN